jgi:hypothetical protein
MENIDSLLEGVKENLREVTLIYLKQINYEGNNEIVKQCL